MRRARLLPVVVLTLLPASALPQGDPIGPEFRVNTFTTSSQWFPAVSFDALGNFVVVWESVSQDYAATSGVYGQRYASSGLPIGPEFRVNTQLTGSQSSPAGAASASVASCGWTGNVQDGSADGVFGQRFASSGAPLGPEFRVNTYTTGPQTLPAVCVADAGTFVVTWNSRFQDGSYWGVYAQRYASTGAPLGAEFRVNTFTTLYQSSPPF